MAMEHAVRPIEQGEVKSKTRAERAIVRRLLVWCRSRRIGAVLLFSAAAAGVVYCLLRVVAPQEAVPKPFSFDPAASWITTHSNNQSCGCFRLDIDIPSKISNAWITLATNGGFEVLTNGNESGRFFLLSPTHPFQKGLSELGQKLTAGDPSIAVNFPREYQWHHHDNAELPIWLDLTPDLHSGHNVLCVEVETNSRTPALILSGEIVLETGEKVPVRSNPEWKAESVPQTLPQDQWTKPHFPVSDWNSAQTLGWKRLFWNLVPKGIYENPFRGQKIRSMASDSVTWIEQDFDLGSKPLEAFLRVVSDTPYQVWINGEYVRPPNHMIGVLGFGPWFVRELVRSPIDTTLDNPPEWLDPENVATLLPGQQRESPPVRDPGVNDISPDQSKVVGTGSRPYGPHQTPPSNDPQGDTKRGASPYADPTRPNRVPIPVLTRDRRDVEYLAYGITSLLRRGRNTIRLGLYKKDPQAVGLSQEPFIAFDGGAQLVDGTEASFASDQKIRSYATSLKDGKVNPLAASVNGPIEPHLLPGKTIFQQVYPHRPWGTVALAVFFSCTGLLLVGTMLSERFTDLVERGRVPCAILASWIVGGLLLRASMLERSEALYWRFPSVWLLLLLIGTIGALAAIILQRKNATGLPVIGSRRDFLGKWRWQLLFALALIFCFALRAWQMDFQPPDADEYTSLQAILSIINTGLPEYQPGIWYTRSGLFHYLAAAVSFVTGGDIYTLRLLAVIFSCATAALVWKITEELTRSRFFALSATALFVIEPYLVFTGHVSRFYQQHQFFNLLLVYFFVRGFVRNLGMRDRYLAILTFLAGVLSQEITVLQVIPLAVCYVLFATRRKWPDEIRLLLSAACASAIIALDVAFHMLKCLTPLEGVSPRVEAKIGWCFAKLANFFTLFISYSRLHLLLSAFLIPGFIIACRRKQTVATCLYIYLFVSIAAVNLLITSKGYRYQYYLIPLWIILAIHGVAECARLLIPAWREFPARISLAGGWVAFAICSFSPWRILNSYDASLGGNPTSPLAYVRDNFRPNDRVAITEPYPDAAKVELGRCDYDISIPILYDFSYRTHGKLVDRNGGGEVIGNLNALQQAFAKSERLWIVFDRYTSHARGQKILWEYPGSRVQLYLQSNCKLVYRSYLWSVYLWDRNSGHYSSFREKPGNWFE
jgi:hypothetical protein